MNVFDSTESKILVTGGAGFIGSALIWDLNQRGVDDVLVADFLGTDEKWRNLSPLRFHDYLEADDLLHRVEADDPALSEIELVFHLGACSATTEHDAAYLVRNNFEYTKTLARWALAHDARFVYASSAATYGDGAHGMSDLEHDLGVFRPLNMYGYSKQLFDLYAAKHGFLDGIVGLKYFNVFGPNEDHKGDMRSLVHKAYRQITETGKVQLFKSHRPDYRDGEQTRDFLYVKDAVNLTIELAETATAGGLVQRGIGPGAHLDRTGHGHLRRARQGAEHRIHRHARGLAGQVPVPHAGRPDEAARVLQDGRNHAAERSGGRLRARLSRAGPPSGRRGCRGDGGGTVDKA